MKNGTWEWTLRLMRKRRPRRSAWRPPIFIEPIMIVSRSRSPSAREASVADRSFLDWPFLEERHRALAAELEQWCARNLRDAGGHDGEASKHNVDEACRKLVRDLGE